MTLARHLLALLMITMTLAVAAPAFAQEVAHVDADMIIPEMAEYKRAKSQVESYGKLLQKNLEARQANMATYYQEVMQKAQAGMLTPVQEQEAQAKLAKMQEDLQKAAAQADTDLAKKESDLTRPLYDKFNAALEAVAAEHGYKYILDKKLLLFAGGPDATSKVKAKLGIP